MLQKIAAVSVVMAFWLGWLLQTVVKLLLVVEVSVVLV
jgi:hypothetical protein